MLIYRVETETGAGPWVDGNKEPGENYNFGSGAGTSWCLGAISSSYRVGQFNTEARGSGAKPRYGFMSLEQLFMYAVPHNEKCVDDATVSALFHSMKMMQRDDLFISIYEVHRHEYDAACADHTQVVFKMSNATLVKRINPTGAYMAQRISQYQRQFNELMAA